MSKRKLILKLLNMKWLDKSWKLYLLNIHADQLDTGTHSACIHS